MTEPIKDYEDLTGMQLTEAELDWMDSLPREKRRK